MITHTFESTGETTTVRIYNSGKATVSIVTCWQGSRDRRISTPDAGDLLGASDDELVRVANEALSLLYHDDVKRPFKDLDGRTWRQTYQSRAVR